MSYHVVADCIFCEMHLFSGRDLFNFRPELMLGDDAEADDMTYERDSDDEGEEGEDKENGAAKLSVKEIALDEFAFDMEKASVRF